MLVLSRQVDERIVIDGEITVTVLAIEGDKVKLGIHAPREIPILREELWQAIQEQERIAADLSTRDKIPALESLRTWLVAETGD